MPLYVFDPVGNLASNRIRNELHTVNSINGVDHNYIVPNNAPFYDTSVVVIDMGTGQALIEEVDYFYAYNFISATERVGSPISGAIAFVDKNRTGNYLVNYQTLGGEYVNEESQAILNGLDTLVRLSNRPWEDIVNVPPVFPPTPHTHRLDNVVGVAEILAKFTSLEAAIRSEERKITLSDITDLNSGYVEPMTQGMASIAAAILTLVGERGNYFVEANTGNSPVTLHNVNSIVWTDVGIAASPAVSGTYQVSFGGNPQVNGLGDNQLIDFRYAVNGSAISHSTITGSILGLNAEDIVTLQLRLRSGDDSGVVIADEGVSCGLTLLRVGD